VLFTQIQRENTRRQRVNSNEVILANAVSLCYYPEFDTKNRKKVPEALNLLACGTFPDFAAARYSLCLLVSAQIFFIFLIGTISLDVQKPNAS
jgi:hypothetical protein